MITKSEAKKIHDPAHPVAEACRHSLVANCIVQGAYIQFGVDLRLYGLAEALRLAEGYQNQGYYKSGSVTKLIQETIDAGT